jgi:uncharacterized protein
MDTNEIIASLKLEKDFLRQQYGVEKIAVYGSYAKGLQNSNSDIDFFVELKKPSYELLVDLYGFLENKFKTKVDIVRKGPHLSAAFLKHIEKEMIYA